MTLLAILSQIFVFAIMVVLSAISILVTYRITARLRKKSPEWESLTTSVGYMVHIVTISLIWLYLYDYIYIHIEKFMLGV